MNRWRLLFGRPTFGLILSLLPLLAAVLFAQLPSNHFLVALYDGAWKYPKMGQSLIVTAGNVLEVHGQACDPAQSMAQLPDGSCLPVNAQPPIVPVVIIQDAPDSLLITVDRVNTCRLKVADITNAMILELVWLNDKVTAFAGHWTGEPLVYVPTESLVSVTGDLCRTGNLTQERKFPAGVSRWLWFGTTGMLYSTARFVGVAIGGEPISYSLTYEGLLSVAQRNQVVTVGSDIFGVTCDPGKPMTLLPNGTCLPITSLPPAKIPFTEQLTIEVAEGNTHSYTLSRVPTSDPAIYRNGLRQLPGVDYVLEGQRFKFLVETTDPASDIVIADY